MLQFNNKNPVGRGLKLTDSPEEKTDLVMYVVELLCLNPIADTKRNAMSPIYNLE